MRLPSLFRTPRHQQFYIKPRYYDPVKEEIQERTKRIKKQMGGNDEDSYTKQISFRKKSNRKAPSSSLLQTTIAIMLVILTFGWLEFGDQIFQYLLYLAVPLYILYRLKKMRKSR